MTAPLDRVGLVAFASRLRFERCTTLGRFFSLENFLRKERGGVMQGEIRVRIERTLLARGV